MAASKLDVESWIKSGKKQKAKYIISVCDTFDWSDYPVYVKKDENLEKIKAKYNGVDMQTINEVIELDSTGNVKKKELPIFRKKGILIWDVPSMHEQVFTTDESYNAELLKWKAKLFTKTDVRVEIRKSFQWYNEKKKKSYGAQLLITVRNTSKNEPAVVISANGKLAMSNAETVMIQMAIEEAKLALDQNKKK